MKTTKLILYCSLVFMNSCYSQSTENIVLINTGPYDKGRIAELILQVSALKPRVLSLDIAFSDYDGNEDDRKLSQVLEDCGNLVMVSTIESISDDQVYFALASRAEFSPLRKKVGFVSAKVEEHQTEIPKQFIVWKRDFNGSISYHFSVQTALSFDSVATIKFIRNSHQLVDIKYKGTRKFKVFSAADVIDGRLTKAAIEGRIVMIGFLGPGDDDKFISPLNRNRKEPDMYGLEYLAHIVAQILE